MRGDPQLVAEGIVEKSPPSAAISRLCGGGSGPSPLPKDKWLIDIDIRRSSRLCAPYTRTGLLCSAHQSEYYCCASASGWREDAVWGRWRKVWNQYLQFAPPYFTWRANLQRPNTWHHFQALFAAYYVVREHAGCAPQPAANCSRHFWGRFPVGASQVTAPCAEGWLLRACSPLRLSCALCVLWEFMRKQVR
jgi:hypothetical protein